MARKKHSDRDSSVSSVSDPGSLLLHRKEPLYTNGLAETLRDAGDTSRRGFSSQKSRRQTDVEPRHPPIGRRSTSAISNKCQRTPLASDPFMFCDRVFGCLGGVLGSVGVTIRCTLFTNGCTPARAAKTLPTVHNRLANPCTPQKRTIRRPD
jgi:hypothetical protein